MSRLVGVLRDPRIAIGGAITLVVLALALAGPWLAPYGQYDIVGKPFTDAGAFLGTDHLGQDVLSRLLWGGRSILTLALLATVLGVALGVLVGVLAAYLGGWLDEALMRLNDVMLAIPQILITLLVLSAVEQPTGWVVVSVVGISHAPRVARVARGVALTYVDDDFIAAAEAIGEHRWRILTTELGPNLVVPLLAEAGLRLTYSIGMIASIGFLGFSTDPGSADWGKMTDENRLGLLVQPWGVLAPVLVIGLFTIGTNLLADGLGQRSAKGA
ncbi:peptide/nickel transport system permease protein [Luteococcus japonicus]|uniref:Oligopeptide transport system permease protein OppC (TC 3.A.1.5.1) n=2 Tax=Luteococcus japonicus TaxID=33984 RepID=A0A1R4JTE3_9ACTN|nr:MULTISPECIES: ABC transporter permease [Luteococcus]MDN5564249.1 ABC transporter permease [Luteococcus sp.]ROR55961.1 peptide/nickel transport system permease protein [Luteococcus japonicus]SJN35360.1 Oligopeptide transport system permease protein OppC (TC 3.A.1.5.1) [Luteococcus japonicus LSP_Lj1]